MRGHELLDQSAPDHSMYGLLGEISHAWAQLDLISSGAFACFLKLDPAEAGIVIGRIETQAKIAKMHQIARHRRETQMATFLSKTKKELTRLRPMRNALTHGAYVGKSANGELFFRMPAEFMVEDNYETAHELFVYEIPEIQQHVMDVTRVAISLLQHFPRQEMQKLFDLPLRVRSKGPEA